MGIREGKKLKKHTTLKQLPSDNHLLKSNEEQNAMNSGTENSNMANHEAKLEKLQIS